MIIRTLRPGSVTNLARHLKQNADNINCELEWKVVGGYEHQGKKWLRVLSLSLIFLLMKAANKYSQLTGLRFFCCCFIYLFIFFLLAIWGKDVHKK